MGRGIAFPRLAYGLAGAIFLSTLGVGVFAFAIPLLALDSDYSGLMLGVSFSGYFLAKLVISPVAGRIADTIGPKSLLTLASTLGMLVPMAALVSQAQECLYAIQFCLGLSTGILKPVGTAAMAAVIPETGRGRIFGMCNAVYNVAFFLAPVIGGFLFFDRDILPVLGFLCACMAASLAAVAFFTAEGASTVDASASLVQPSGPGRSWLKGTLLLAVCGRTACTSCLLAFYPVLISQHLHGPPWMVGTLFALPSLVAFICLPVGGWLADRYDRVTLTVTGMSVSAVCLALASRIETPIGYVLLGAVLGLGSSLSFPASMALASSLGRRQGHILGWFHGAANAGFVIGPLACGFLVEHFAEISIPMTIMGILGVVMTLPLALHKLADKPVFLRVIPGLLFTVCLLASGFIGHRTATIPRSSEASMNSVPLRFAGVAMGNVVNMTLFETPEDTAAAHSEAAFKAIARLEADLSHRNVTGSIGKVNLAAGESPVPVSDAAFAVIERALGFSRASNGVFDITIGAVTTLPNYYQKKAAKEKTALVDYRKLERDASRHTVFLPQKGMALDLGGLAKGTILDAAALTLRQRGVQAALVEAGGDLFCYGDRQWRVGIQDPRGDGLLGVINVRNAGVCGSGDYYQYAMVEENGHSRRKHHILDPALLDSADSSIAVTVTAPDAETADALATTLFILGPAKGLALLTQYKDCAALWVLPDHKLVKSPDFPPFIPVE